MSDFLTVETRVWLVTVDGYERPQIADTEREARALARTAYREATGTEPRAASARPATRAEIDAWCDAVDLALDEPTHLQPTAIEVDLRQRLRLVQTGTAALPGPTRLQHQRPYPTRYDAGRAFGRLWIAIGYNIAFALFAIAPLLVVAAIWPTIPGTSIPDPAWWIPTAGLTAGWFLIAWVAFRPIFDDVLDLERHDPEPPPGGRQSHGRQR